MPPNSLYISTRQTRSKVAADNGMTLKDWLSKKAEETKAKKQRDKAKPYEPSKGVRTIVEIIYKNWGGMKGLMVALPGEAWPVSGPSGGDPQDPLNWSKGVLKDLKKLSNTTKGNPKEAWKAVQAAMLVRQNDKADNGHLVRNVLGRDANIARLNIEREREVKRVLERKR